MSASRLGYRPGGPAGLWHGPCCSDGREDTGVAYGHERDVIPQRPSLWPLLGVVLSVAALGWALRSWWRRDATAAEADVPQRTTDTDANDRFGPFV